MKVNSLLYRIPGDLFFHIVSQELHMRMQCSVLVCEHPCTCDDQDCVSVFVCVFVHASTHVYACVNNPALRTQSSNEQEHQRLEEHLQFLLKRKKLASQQRDLAGEQQHQFTESQMRQEHGLREAVVVQWILCFGVSDLFGFQSI